MLIKPHTALDAFEIKGVDTAGEQRALLNILEDMQADKEELENQRIATFNIMDDITEAQEELKQKYLELDALKSLTQSLGMSLELYTVMRHIVEAIRKVFPDVTIAYALAPLESSIVSNSIYIHTKEILGEKYLSAINEQIRLGLETMPNIDAEGLRKLLKGKFYFEIVEGKRDSKSNALPQSQINVPIVVPDAIAGLLNISSSKQGIFNKSELDVMYAIVGSASQTIMRLKTLIASEHSRLQDLVESMSNAVLMFDANRQIVVANPAMKKIIRIEEESFGLGDVLDFFKQNVTQEEIKDGQMKDLSQAVEEAVSSTKTVHIEELPLERKFYEIFITPVRDWQNKSSGGAIILHDITHITEVDRLKTEFLSVASHQLRTPLGSMRWNMEMLLGGDFGDLKPEVKETVKHIYESNTRMITLVNDLLNVSRIDQGRVADEPKLTDILKIIQDAVDEMQPLAKQQSVAINFEVKKDHIPKIMLDPKRFREVIQNLLSNAVKYNKPQGTVNINVERTDHHVEIKIADTGMGIPKKDQKKLFSKFFRAENAVLAQTEGSGLGLFVVKSYVEAWGGKVEFESQEGKGTTFIITLPFETKSHILDKNLAKKPHTQ